ncbi:MAG: pyridoxamine 5'-phosphate oxidase family protein [Haloarculaceae archaeon]
MTVDDLEAYGITRMSDDEIDRYLSNRVIGVLGLPTEDAPYLLPMSYTFDDDRLYFTFLGDDDSRKARASDRADAASFLVYSAETMFNWRSVLLTGTIERVPESESAAVADAMDTAWRPEAFARAGREKPTTVHRFRIGSRDGIKHTGLPPGFEPRED